MATQNFIKVFLADDHCLFRRGVRSVIDSLQAEGLTVIGEAADGTALIDALTRMEPHVVLMDIGMPGLSGIEATAILKQRYAHIGVIGLSFSDHSGDVLAMVHAGADGYLLKDTQATELVHAIKLVHSGYCYYTPAVSTFLKARIKEERNVQMKLALTPREKKILQMICQGQSSKEIAQVLFVSKRTIDSFREKIMKKTGVKNSMQLLRYALKEEIIRE
ncbi:MAG TPA: response regulator transcription factor [Flavisolibacter sp.]|jgi:DNA-binding NarL/FixJ family response regulator|nr:response regulator transcription factor [Flavisolibacter sp.]